MSKHIDSQGFSIKVGVAYFRVVGMPGPETSAVVIEKLNSDGTCSGFDPLFRLRCEGINPDSLWRPLKIGWDGKGEKRCIVEYAGEQALDLEP
ncbi:hypothetical protein [Pseudomonas bohemica]|uniref:hypothetical protein n=1 Tax=Pseudomonas bohemica TaxID=2044872 RepID=UPI000DA6210F|nr:hypothetical protein [Pseudomonas bohemica]